MKVLTGLKLAALLVVMAAVPLVFQGSKASAQAVRPQSPAQTPTPQPAAQTAKYSYTAQPGDSYTRIARKAAQTYGKKFNLKLSEAKIIFIETNLTRAAGSPHLAVGQKLDITEATLKQWVDKAVTLPAADEAAWAHYVQFVDFNTDHVGQAHSR